MAGGQIVGNSRFKRTRDHMSNLCKQRIFLQDAEIHSLEIDQFADQRVASPPLQHQQS